MPVTLYVLPLQVTVAGIDTLPSYILEANRHCESQKHSHHFFHHKIVLLVTKTKRWVADGLIILKITSFFGLLIYTIREYKFGQKPPIKKYFFSSSKKETLYRI